MECTLSIAFLGTPHSGAGMATWAGLLSKSIGLIKQTNSRILEVLRADSEVLQRIQIEFHSMLRQREKNGKLPIAITCFYEELPLPGVGEVGDVVWEEHFRPCDHSSFLTAPSSIVINRFTYTMPSQPSLLPIR